MANQSPDRRQVMAMLAKVAVVGQFPGFSKWVCASNQANSTITSAYTPLFFTPQEFRLVDVLTELIIPTDESPGAHAAGVAEFIDFMVSHDDNLQFPFRTGLAWLDADAFKTYRNPFVELDSKQQSAILTKLATRQAEQNDQPGRAFFLLARQYTTIGFYTSRMGLESLNYPGLHFYSSSPACNHTSDPQHTSLPDSKA